MNNIIEISKKLNKKFIFDYSTNILYWVEDNVVRYTKNSHDTIFDYFLEFFNFDLKLEKTAFYTIPLFTKDNIKTNYKLLIDDNIIINVINDGFYIYKN